MSNGLNAALYGTAILCVAVLGVLNLQMPFLADQAVSLLAAQNIEAGGTLYRDFWDNKMPGLFWFYWLAGKLFGYDEFGIHLFELGWMLSFSIVLAYALRDYYYHRWLSAVAPIAVVGTYYAAAGANQLTLLEIVVTFPLFLTAWSAIKVTGPARKVAGWCFFSGVCAGIVVTFKLVLAPLCALFWLTTSIYAHFKSDRPLNWLVKNIWLPVSIGVVAVLGAVVIKFWFDGALEELLWTAFEYPPAALESSPKAPIQRLFVSFLFVMSNYAVLIVPICFAIFYWWRFDRDRLTTILIIWLIGGLALILIQRFSWWTYHFFLLFPPAGILGVRGIDAVAKRLSDISPPARAFSLPLCGLFSFMVVFSLATICNEKIVHATNSFLFKDESVLEYRTLVRPEYGITAENTKFLRSNEALPGKIAVFGDPLNYVLSGRHPAIPMVGWPWEYFLQSQWLELPQQIIDAAPVYIFIEDREQKIMDVRQGGVRELIYSRYVALRRVSNGHWFRLKKEYLN